jgi:tetratricopeptide (TPR) repeat protein
MNVTRLKNSRTGVTLCLLFFLTSCCHPRSCLLEPTLCYSPLRKQFELMTSDFEALTIDEDQEEWSKEVKIGISLGKEFDFYRAITCFKRALVLMPEEANERRLQLEFYIVQCYFLGHKYHEAIEAFEFSDLRYATGSFPAFRDLLIMLYESYLKTEQCEKAKAVLLLLEKGDPESALELKIFTCLDYGNLPYATIWAENHPSGDDVAHFNRLYCQCSKSVRKAQLLNAFLPGSGYFYVGQKKTALTSLVLNTCFIAAAYYFFDTGNWGAGVFTTSLEFGWYFGGINGAGLAAKEYNECLYNTLGKELLIKRNLFPVLMLQTGF